MEDAHKHNLILIADDDQDFKEILSTKLLNEGFEIAEAETGREAIEKTKNLHPSLVIMDIQMPDINGTEAVLEIRKNQNSKDVPIVFFSNLLYPWPGIKEDKEKFAMELGAVTFLSKEDNLDQVVKKIKTLIQPGTPEASDSASQDK